MVGGNLCERYRLLLEISHPPTSTSHPTHSSGDVVTMECVEKLIKKDMRHPGTGVQLADSDIIPLQMGGTGFSGTNDQLSTKGARPVAQV